MSADPRVGGWGASGQVPPQAVWADGAAAPAQDAPVVAPQGPGKSGKPAAGNARSRVQDLVSAVTLTSRLREDYQAVAGRLPLLLEVGGEIQKHKDQADDAATQAAAKITSLLESFRDTTEQMAQAMEAQQGALQALLDNPQDLADMLRQGKADLVGVLSRLGPVGAAAPASSLGQDQTMTGALGLLKAAEQKAQHQVGELTQRLQAMVSAAVEEKTKDMRQVIEQLQKGQSPGGGPSRGGGSASRKG